MHGSIAGPMVLRITRYLRRTLGLGPCPSDGGTYWKRSGIIPG